VVSITVVLGIFILPRFSFNIADQEITWPGIDFQTFAIDSPLGNFSKGSGIYSDFVVSYSSSFTVDQDLDKNELFEGDVELLRRRLDASGLRDINIRTVKSDEEYSLDLVFPNYYQRFDPERKAALLLAAGNMQIWENDPTVVTGETDETEQAEPTTILDQLFGSYTPVISELTVSDIETIGADTITRFGGNLLRIKFSQFARDNFNAVVARSQGNTEDFKPAILAIAGNPEFVLFQSPDDLTLFAQPISAAYDISDLRIVATYLLGGVGIRLHHISNGMTEVAPLYALEGRTFLAVTLILAGLSILVWSIMKFKFKGMIDFALGLVFYSLVGLSLMKLFAMPISVGMLLGLLLMVVWGAVVLQGQMEGDKALLANGMKKNRNGAVVLFTISGLVFLFGYSFGILGDAISSVLFMSIALMIATIFGFKHVILHYNETNGTK